MGLARRLVVEQEMDHAATLAGQPRQPPDVDAGAADCLADRSELARLVLEDHHQILGHRVSLGRTLHRAPLAELPRLAPRRHAVSAMQTSASGGQGHRAYGDLPAEAARLSG